MRAKKFIAFALGVLLLGSLSLPALADGQVKITTTVPDTHAVTVLCGTGGRVSVNGLSYTGTNAFTVSRHDSFSLHVAANEGYALDSITSDSANGMTLGTNSATWIRVCGDIRINVSFRSVPPTPDSPAPDPPTTPDPTTTDPEPDPPTPDLPTTPDPTTTDPTPDLPTPDPPTPDPPTPDPPTPDPPAPDPTPDPAPDPAPDPPTPDPATPDAAATGVVVSVIGDEKQITAEAVIVGETAEISVDVTAFGELLETDTRAKTVTIDISEIDTDIHTVVIPVSTIRTTVERATSSDNELTGMDIIMPRTAVTFDAAALEAITEQAEQDTVSLYVKEISAEILTPTQQEALKAVPENAVVLEVTLRSGAAVISDLGGGSAEIRLPYTPQINEDPATITVWHVAQDGALEEIACRYENGFVLFTVEHFSNYLIKPGTVSADTGVTPEPAATPEPPADVEHDDGSHCFICGLVGRTVVPWCRVIPLSLAAALCGTLWLCLRRRRK